MPEKGWQQRFDDPIPLPDGGELRTLLDAGRYIEALPKAKHDRPEWQTATHFLLMADWSQPRGGAGLWRDDIRAIILL